MTDHHNYHRTTKKFFALLKNCIAIAPMFSRDAPGGSATRAERYETRGLIDLCAFAPLRESSLNH
jgi:hypothetical protein